MIDKKALIERAIKWQNSHPPITGYTRKVFETVCNANLPNGANLLTQIAAQFTGVEEPVDLVNIPEEDRLDYSNTSRWSLDYKTDCSSTWEIFLRIFFNKSMGSWSEEQYSWCLNNAKKISWEERRIFDIVFYNFKANLGRRVSHVAGIVVEPKDDKNGMIGHTTSPSNPFRFEDDAYAASNRVAIFRVISDEEYKSLFVDDNQSSTYTTLVLGMSGDAVKKYQQRINAHLGDVLRCTGYFGDITRKCVQFFQSVKHLPVTGMIDFDTKNALEAVPDFPVLVHDRKDTSNIDPQRKRSAVRVMKSRLNKYGYRLDDSNPYFLGVTENAVKDFQRTHTDANGNKLVVDGVCGPKTWAALLKRPEN